jgi:hypothetical protein
MNQLGSIQVREGDLLAGKYRIERVLGVGGMGVVVAARHEELDQLVAIKFVRDESLANDEAVERFLRESRAAARLRSEHVARVLDVGRLDSGAPYMVMEFLEGSDLGQVLTRDGPMAVELAVALMLQVCEAVAEAHAAGIVHRDLKPENLFLTRTVGGSPKMKVLDFGVSKSTSLTKDGKGALTRTRAILGSPLYMAPEQMRSSRDVDVRIDVWALGVVLFELLTLRSPFEAETMPELCLKVVGEPPLSMAELRPDLPPAIVAVIERCLEKDREKRFANAAELAMALEPFAPFRASRASRASAFSRSSQGAGLAGFEANRPSAAGAAPSLDVPVLTPSIPAAWGAEGLPASNQAATARARRIVWLVVPLLAVAAVVAVFAIRRSGAGRAPPSAATSAPSYAPTTSAMALPPPAALVTTAVSLAPAAEATALPTPSASVSSSSPLSPAAPVAASASARPVVAPASPPPAKPSTPPRSVASDDDIPALR